MQCADVPQRLFQNSSSRLPSDSSVSILPGLPQRSAAHLCQGPSCLIKAASSLTHTLFFLSLSAPVSHWNSFRRSAFANHWRPVIAVQVVHIPHQVRRLLRPDSWPLPVLYKIKAIVSETHGVCTWTFKIRLIATNSKGSRQVNDEKYIVNDKKYVVSS